MDLGDTVVLAVEDGWSKTGVVIAVNPTHVTVDFDGAVMIYRAEALRESWFLDSIVHVPDEPGIAVGVRPRRA